MSKSLLIVLFGFGCLVCPVSTGAVAQKGWVSGGLGIGVLGFAYTGNISYVLGDSWLVSLRCCKTNEKNPIFNWGGPFPKEKASDVALLVGVVGRWGTETASVSLGPAVVSTTQRGQPLPASYVGNHKYYNVHYEETREKVIGTALQSQLMLKHAGLVVFANLNSAQSFVGVTFSLRLPF